MSIEVAVFLTALATGLGYAVLGMLQAFAEGESFDGVSFLKTVVLSLVSAGVVTATTGNIIVSIAGSGIIVVVLDKAINTARNLYETGSTTAPTPSTTPSTSTPSKSL